MIARLHGRLLQKNSDNLILDVGGVGYEVFMSKTALESLRAPGEELEVWIHTHVNEGAITLFGFVEPAEKKMFRKLLLVSGVGPKMALQTLSGMGLYELVRTLMEGNVGRLTQIHGVGKKTAERMVVELKDKMLDLLDAGFDAEMAATPISSKQKTVEEVISALVNLGYVRPVAEKALNSIGIIEGENFEGLFKKTLSRLSAN